MIEAIGDIMTVDKVLAVGPDELTAGRYQDAAWRQIFFDRGTDGEKLPTIGGVPFEAKLFLGIKEEIDETTEEDYDPDHSLDGLPHSRWGAFLFRDEVRMAQIPSAYMYHRKEFGDVSWYATNFLTLARISVAAALEARITELGGNGADISTVRDFDRAMLRLAPEHERETVPGQRYLSSADRFIRAGEAMLRPVPTAASSEVVIQKRRAELLQRAGSFFGSMSVVLQTRLDGTLADAFYDNLEKIEGRFRRGTVLCGSGDKR